MMKISFNINTIFLSLFGIFVGYNILNYYLTAVDIYKPPIGNLPVPIEVGKSKIYVSKNQDASMYTEYSRRKAVIKTNVCRIKDPRFGFWNKDSTNGTLESYFLTSIYNERPRDLLFDGNGAYDENDFRLNGVGSGLVADGGDANTEYCIVE
jgi:hypothetical protein